ncbi:protein BIG GRAIN 1-like [Lolium perenne]|uniref:protein BIG GRAIN 1-like n=1 Tax=Lolium perenne TaxID=4522 RepID=UPI0021F5FE01|nr:protein BIG GRAIN 1-like [Lolium perenne]
MEMRWAPARPRVPRRPAHQPSFSSTLLDAICDSMDGPEARRTTSAANAYSTSTSGPKKQEREAALHCYYYKPALASSYRARDPHTPGTTAGDCSGRGYFSSSEAEHSLRRLRPIRTSVGLAPTQKQQPQYSEMARTKKSTAATRGCSRPASPGARLASLLNSIFSAKRLSAPRRMPTDQEPVCSTAPSYARSCLSKKARPPASRSRSTRMVKFLDIDGEVAVAAASVGRCSGIPVVEVEEELLRSADVQVDMYGGEKSSGASLELFELENLGVIAPESGLPGRDGSYRNELPVYGSTGVAGLRGGVAHHRPYASLGRSCRNKGF